MIQEDAAPPRKQGPALSATAMYVARTLHQNGALTERELVQAMPIEHLKTYRMMQERWSRGEDGI